MSEPDREPPPPDPVVAGPPRNASLLEVVGAVFGSFLGIRKGHAMRKDAVTIRPHQVILVGIVLAALFVVSLLLLVRTIMRSAGV
ncbi:MAG: DUF2970 domain-containing protein [Burkholderiales bacterium]